MINSFPFKKDIRALLFIGNRSTDIGSTSASRGLCLPLSDSWFSGYCPIRSILAFAFDMDYFWGFFEVFEQGRT